MTTLSWGTPVPAFPNREEKKPVTTRFEVEWLEEDAPNLIIAAKIFALSGDAGRYHVGDIHFNGNEWLFIRIDREGEQVMDGLHYIPVDPDAEAQFRAEHASIISGGEAHDATLAAYRVRRKLHRDDSRELAETGGQMQARLWWNTGYWAGDEANVAETEFACGHTFQGSMTRCPHCGT